MSTLKSTLLSCETFIHPTGRVAFGTVSERGGHLISSVKPPTLPSITPQMLLSSMCGDTLTTEPFLYNVEKVTGITHKPIFNRPNLITKCHWCETPYTMSLSGMLHCESLTCRGRLAGRLITFFGPWTRLTPFKWNDLVKRLPDIQGISSLFHKSIKSAIGSILDNVDWMSVLHDLERIECLVFDAKSSTRHDDDLVTLLYGFGIPTLTKSHLQTLVAYLRDSQDPPFPYLACVLENAESLHLAGISTDDACSIAYHAKPLQDDLFAFSDMCEIFQSYDPRHR